MTITIDDKQHITPDSWNDCSLQQLLFCYTMLMVDFNSIFEASEILPARRLSIMKHLLQLTDEHIEEFTPEQRYNLMMATTEFALDQVKTEEDQPSQYQISLTLTKNPYPYFQFKTKKSKKRRYYGPGDNLENISIYELGTTFTLFENYLESNDQSLIDELLAVLYRPHKPVTKKNKRKAYEGDRRLPFLGYEATVACRKKNIANIPPPVKQIMLFWFASCRQHIISSYPNIFEQPENTHGKKTGNDYGWGGLLMSLSDGLVHLNEISKQNYRNAFTRLSYLEDQRKLQELKSISL